MYRKRMLVRRAEEWTRLAILDHDRNEIATELYPPGKKVPPLTKVLDKYPGAKAVEATCGKDQWTARIVR